MRINHLSLTNFRNFARLEVDIPPGTVVLVGDNAQGKTSLLEAVYYLAGATSPHTTSARQLINFLTLRSERPFARLVAEVESHDRVQQIEIRILLEPVGPANNLRLRKEILINQQKYRVRDLSGVFNAVLFLPQDMRIIEGSPGERRRYLDAALCQGAPIYAAALTEYGKVLAQRNALLRRLAERGGDASQLEFWDNKISRHAYTLVCLRTAALAEIEKIAGSIHQNLTRGVETFRLLYQPSFAPPLPDEQTDSPSQQNLADKDFLPEEEFIERYLQKLKESRREELARKTTVLGPHRDDFIFLSNGIDLTMYGSRGQNRTAMLSMKLAEVEWLHDKSGEWPILLLDEVLAELDIQRREDLLQRINDSKQVLLTSADLEMFNPCFRGKATIWSLSAGRIQTA
ncbi:MAG: DNA replication/repair protein RecF [Anaerolineales bacterium]|nr:DNA replication/repair protein RecF [Anaerolineales bacterium]